MTHTVTEAQNGSTVAMAVGDVLEIHLPENPTSGYRWALDEVDETRVAAGSPSYRGEDDRPGSGGMATWTLRAKAPGTTRVTLKHWRHWEGDRSVVQRFAVTLHVKPA